mgnify:CR=1 FL=1
MSLREWLIIIGALLILGVIVDGLRRMHRARQESLEIARGMGSGDIGQTPIDDDYNSELPNGGARVVGAEKPPGPGARPRREPTWTDETDQAAGGPAESGPEASADQPSFQRAQPDNDPGTESITASDDDGIVGPARVRQDPGAPSHAETADQTDRGSAPGMNAGQLWQKIRDGAARVGEAAKPTDREPGEAAADPGAAASEVPEATAEPSNAGERPMAGANRPEAEEVVVVNVHCRDDEDRYQGKALQKLLEACGMEFGDLGIYHRHEEPDTRSPVQFSVASAVAPGTLRPEEIESLETPGVSFFMSLPGPRDPVQAYDYMLETAQTLARNLGGELRDENHSVMTTQTIEHGRQRIREFERKRRSAVKA